MALFIYPCLYLSNVDAVLLTSFLRDRYTPFPSAEHLVLTTHRETQCEGSYLSHIKLPPGGHWNPFRDPFSIKDSSPIFSIGEVLKSHLDFNGFCRMIWVFFVSVSCLMHFCSSCPAAFNPEEEKSPRNPLPSCFLVCFLETSSHIIAFQAAHLIIRFVQRHKWLHLGINKPLDNNKSLRGQQLKENVWIWGV